MHIWTARMVEAGPLTTKIGCCLRRVARAESLNGWGEAGGAWGQCTSRLQEYSLLPVVHRQCVGAPYTLHGLLDAVVLCVLSEAEELAVI